MKKILVSLCMVFLLTSCVPVAIVTAAAIVGVIVYDKRDLQTQMSDDDIALLAQDRINADFELSHKASISVSAFNRVVLLVGQAPTNQLRDRAYQIVRGIHGVKTIYNEIEIAGPASNLSHSNDAIITAKVKTALMTILNLNSTSIKVVTEAAKVYLMGTVSSDQAMAAVDAARHVSGVREVVTMFE